MKRIGKDHEAELNAMLVQHHLYTLVEATEYISSANHILALEY